MQGSRELEILKKPKKKRGLRNILYVVVSFFLATMLVLFLMKGVILEVFLRKHYGIELFNTSWKPLSRILYIEKIKIPVHGKEWEFIYVLRNVEIKLKSINTVKRIINVEEIKFTNLELLDKELNNVLVHKINLVGNLKNEFENKDNISLEDVEKLETNRVLVENEGEKENFNIKNQEEQDINDLIITGLRSIQSIFSNERTRGNIRDMMNIIKVIDSTYLEKEVDEIIEKSLREQVGLYGQIRGNMVNEISKRLNLERIRTTSYVINLEKIVGGIEFFGDKYIIEIRNESNELPGMKKTSVFRINDIKNNFLFTGEINIPKVSGKTNMEIKEFNYKSFPRLKEYIKEGKIEINNNSIFNQKRFTQEGEIYLRQLKLDSDRIVQEIANRRGISQNSIEYRLLKSSLKRLRRLKIRYRYDSLDDNLEIRTDIVKEVRSILTANLQEILMELSN